MASGWTIAIVVGLTFIAIGLILMILLLEKQLHDDNILTYVSIGFTIVGIIVTIIGSGGCYKFGSCS